MVFRDKKDILGLKRLDPPVPSPPTLRRAASNNAGFSFICWARAGSFCAMNSFRPNLREGLSPINRPIAGGLVAYKILSSKLWIELKELAFASLLFSGLLFTKEFVACSTFLLEARYATKACFFSNPRSVSC
jgi:hypothetical protein